MEIKIKTLLEGSLGIAQHDNGLPIEGATFANETFVSADESILTVATDPGDGPDDAILDATGVAVGSTTVHVEADVTFKDPSTGESRTAHLAADIPVTVTAGETEVDLVINWGKPPAPVVPQP